MYFIPNLQFNFNFYLIYIKPFTEHVDKKTRLSQIFESCRNYNNINKAFWLQTAISRQQQKLAKYTAERTDGARHLLTALL